MKKYVFIAAFIILAISSLFIGAIDFNFFDVINLDANAIEILTLSRIPRLLTVLITGFIVAISGFIMQKITRNKFVSPATATTVEGAKMGYLVALIFFGGSGLFIQTSLVFVFSLILTLLFVKIVSKINFKDIIIVPLIGMILSSVFASITDVVAYKYELLPTINAWTTLNFTSILQGKYELIFFCIIIAILLFLMGHYFNVIGFGEDFTNNLGIKYKRFVNIGIVLISLSTSIVLIVVGIVPYIGLIVPNIITLIFGDNIKNNLLKSGLLGAFMMLICDIISRVVIYPNELQINVTLGVVGSFIFLLLIIREVKNA